jgi:hypothetical protein
MGFEVIRGYSYYPVLHVFTAAASSITGLDITFFAHIFPFLAEPLVLVFFYLGLRKLLSKEVAIWSSLIFSLNGYWHFWEYFIREFIGLIFFSMCLYCVFTVYKSRGDYRKFFFLGLIAAVMTVLSHHWTSYNLVLILVVLTVFPTLYARIHPWLMKLIHREPHILLEYKNLILPSFLGIVVILTFSWGIFIGYNLIIIQSRQFLEYLTNVFSFSPSFVGHSVQGVGLQNRILLFFGYLILGFLGVIEFVRRFLKEQKNHTEYIFESWFVFSAIYIVFTTFLLPSGGDWWVVSWRSWSFAFFGLAPLTAMSITRIQNMKPKITLRFKWQSNWKRLLPLILVFPLVSAILTAPPEILQPDYPKIDDSFYQTALWVREYLPNASIALDQWSRSVIIPYGRATTFQTLRWPGGHSNFLQIVYQYGDLNGSSFPDWEIVVFNKRISEWIPDASTNSSILEQEYNRVHDSKSLSIYVKSTYN